jgi:aryl-alcohol dehydrogenase-like predicted oxidoreductase
MLHRRELLALAVCSAPALRAQSEGEWRNRQPGMSYRRLGRTNFMISGVVMGGNTISPKNWEHVLAAIDMGLNYLDTAPVYGGGGSELGNARVLKSRPRDKVFLNTKVSMWDINRGRMFQEIFDSLPASDQARIRTAAKDEVERRKADAPDYFIGYFGGQAAELERVSLANVMEKEFGRRIDRGKNYRQLILDSLDQSLKRLGTDHVDLLSCPHGASSPYELLNFPEIFEAFEILKKAGKVRYLSVSAHTDPAGVLEAAVKSKMYSSAMVAYNIVNRGYVDAALEQARKADLGIIAMKAARPVFSGRQAQPEKPEHAALIEKAMPGAMKRPLKAYSWALRNPHLTAVISEMTNREMVEENVPLAKA